MGIDIEEERSKVIGRFGLELIGNHLNTEKKSSSNRAFLKLWGVPPKETLLHN